MRTFGYSLRMKHQDCDVVLYGDSTALTGLDPDIVQRITGLKSCNIAEAGWIEDVVGTDFPLQAYLKDNKRPRFIVTDITPSLFARSRPPSSSIASTAFFMNCSITAHRRYTWASCLGRHG